MYYNDGKGEITTLIDDEARVYKGGSWKDRAYWLNQGSRRYMNQKRSKMCIRDSNTTTMPYSWIRKTGMNSE